MEIRRPRRTTPRTTTTAMESATTVSSTGNRKRRRTSSSLRSQHSHHSDSAASTDAAAGWTSRIVSSIILIALVLIITTAPADLDFHMKDPFLAVVAVSAFTTTPHAIRQQPCQQRHFQKKLSPSSPNPFHCQLAEDDNNTNGDRQKEVPPELLPGAIINGRINGESNGLADTPIEILKIDTTDTAATATTAAGSVDMNPGSTTTNTNRNSNAISNGANESEDTNNNHNNKNSKKAGERKRMNLLWCQTDRCVDVVREEVVGEHNQIVLNGPATGQVAYRWSQKPALPYRNSTPPKFSPPSEETSSTTESATRIPSVLLLVKKGDDDLMRIAAETVSELTRSSTYEGGDIDDDDINDSSSHNDSSESIRILLAPDLAAKLKHYHGVDNPLISLFESPSTGCGGGGRGMTGQHDDTMDPNLEFNWKVRHVDDDEEEWIKDMMLYKQESSKQFPDLIVCLGGDGLLLHASMMFQGPFPPLLAISGGSLGFLTPFHEEELVDAVRIALGMSPKTKHSDDMKIQSSDSLQTFPPNMENDNGPLTKPPHLFESTLPRFTFGLGDFICMSIRMRLDCRVVNPEGIVRARYNVLNEVVVDRGSSPYLAALECFCDDVHLTTVQADGIIFATPTGSTAYSMSAGGSVVHPGVPSILVTPICPHVLSFRSMVFPDSVVLTCHVPDDARASASVAFDGKHRRELQRGDSVQIQMSSYPMPTINKQCDTSDWLESLKRSFNFNTRPRQRPL